MDLLSSLFGALWNYAKRALDALKQIPFSKIWQYINKIFVRVHQVIAWIQKYVIQPWQKMRAQLIALYNHYFGPIIKMIDTIRSMVGVIGVFDRKLAYQIDQFLWKIESDLYAPLYAALRRINAVTSTITALITPLGLLDRNILIQSLERDWKSVWRVLLNNGDIYSPAGVPPAPSPLLQLSTDFQQFVDSGSGPFQDTNLALEKEWEDALSQLG